MTTTTESRAELYLSKLSKVLADETVEYVKEGDGKAFLDRLTFLRRVIAAEIFPDEEYIEKAVNLINYVIYLTDTTEEAIKQLADESGKDLRTGLASWICKQADAHKDGKESEE